ncbi:MAG: hypothetical protein LBU18_07725 [Treponema sp.]|jgi:hypothetical protein|nr:hypothetical protein [Treponema sp.]
MGWQKILRLRLEAARQPLPYLEIGIDPRYIKIMEILRKSGPRKSLILTAALFIICAACVWGQYDYLNDPASLVGLSLRDLIAAFGVPQSVYATRGPNTWQDDVVFAYGDWEFYIHRDRVWQISLKTAYGIAIGERREVLPLILGNGVQVYEDYSIYTYSNRSWPIALRFNSDRNGLITAIFIYRADM